MSGTDAFFQCRSKGERLIGTYLHPMRFFGEVDPGDDCRCTEVIRSVSIDSCEVLVTRMGGLFAHPPAHLSDPYRDSDGGGPEKPDSDLESKIEFEELAASAFNQLICEFATVGVVSEPVSPVHIAYGQLIEGHALVMVGSGGREMYIERTIGPSLGLLRHDWLTWKVEPEDVLDQACCLTRTRCLSTISGSLAALVPGAYYYYSRRQPAEAVMDAWTVTEQMLDQIWGGYLSRIHDRSRRQRLRDARTYTAAVRIEMLCAAGVIDQGTQEQLHMARKHRNDLAHRAKIQLTAAADCLEAMKTLIEYVCGTTIAPAHAHSGVNW